MMMAMMIIIIMGHECERGMVWGRIIGGGKGERRNTEG
jgi:hypothetical protein